MQTRTLIVLCEAEGLTKSYGTSNTHEFRNRASMVLFQLGLEGKDPHSAFQEGAQDWEWKTPSYC